MPVYEYRCAKCGDFEHTQRITEPALQRCPTCKRKVQRLISNTSFQLKGSGWYVTDYARSGGGKDKGKKDGAGESASPASGSSDAGGTSESGKSDKTEKKAKTDAPSPSGTKAASA
jgi:putative FmdB family regulatory protein